MLYYVIITAYVDRFFMILASMERGDPTLYYGTKQLYFGRVNFKFTGWLAPTPPPPPLGRRVTKKAQKDEG